MKLRFSLLLVLVFIFLQAQAVTGYKVGNTAPEFTLKSLAGDSYSLSSLRQKKHVLLVFWAVDCVYCYAHIKAFNKAQNDFKRTLTVAAINIGGEYPIEVAEYVKDNNLKYLILSERLNNLDVSEQYHVLGTPTLVLISPEGKVLFYGHTVPNLKRWLK